LVASHQLSLNPRFLAAGTEYHFVVKSVDASGNKASSQDATFSTKGVMLTVTVTNQKKQAVKSARVTVAGVSGITNSSGKVVLNDLPIGTQDASVLFTGKTTKAKVKIEPIANKGSSQTATIRIDTGGQFLGVWLVLTAAGIIAIVAGGNYYLWRKKQGREAQKHFPQITEQVAADTQTDKSPSLLDISSTPTVDSPGTIVEGQQTLGPAEPTINPENNAGSKQGINPNER
jgi:hypothetical protein